MRGLACGGGGALTVERAVSRVAGVARVYVNPATEMAYVEYDEAGCDAAAIAAAIRKAGFTPGAPV